MKSSLLEYTIVLVIVAVIALATIGGLAYLFSYVIMYVWNYFAVRINPAYMINQWVALGILLIIGWISSQFKDK